MAHKAANKLLLDAATSLKTILSDTHVIGRVLQTITSTTRVILARVQSTVTSDTKVVQRVSSTILSNTNVRGTSLQQVFSDTNVLIPAEYATSVSCYNDTLFISCDTDPAKIVMATIIGGIPYPFTYRLDAVGETFKNAQALSIDSIHSLCYLACADGLVAEIDITDPETRNELNVSDSDDLISIASYGEYKTTFVSTDNSNFELYSIDDSTVYPINTNFAWLKRYTNMISNILNFVFDGRINTDFRFVKRTNEVIRNDLRFLTIPAVSYVPISANDLEIYINGTLISDYTRSSVQLRFNADEDSQVIFMLTRKHDRLDYTLEGVYNQITNNNAVVVTLRGITLFTGTISNLQCTGSNESVTVTATGEEYAKDSSLVTLSLPGVNEQLNVYHVLVDDITIDNPTILPGDENPRYYRGIKMNLGSKEVENYFKEDSYVSLTAEDLETFEPDQNYTYFWFISGENFMTGWRFFNKYIGTSLAPLSGDTYEIYSATFFKQREFAHTVTNFGDYYVGTAPYKEISTKNGEYVSWDKWVDKEDGIYHARNQLYYYNAWARKVANVEYLKLKNINGGILPRTSASIDLTLDAFLYYHIKLLQRINLANTTQAGIYENLNGFPVSVKSISIDIGSMRASLGTSNEWAQSELTAIDNTLPTEPSPYIFADSLYAKKYDLAKEGEID